jgi:putative intracellular protease/amidase
VNNERILFVLTNHDRLGPAGDISADKTGFHLAEAARPWAVLTQAGYAIELASPKGGKAPIDPSSRDLDDEVNARFMSDANMATQIDNTHALKDVQLGDYDAIYFPGGHGTMWDFPESDDIQSAIRTMYEDGKVVAAVCHGPAAFVNVKLSDGSWFVNGKTLSTFTDEEERAVEKDSIMPFLLEKKLISRGAKIAKAGNFEKSVSIDQRVVSGQNPASAQGVGEGIRDLLEKQKSKAA